ncbi:MAG: pseudouridine synthase [Verrucomicrobiota bacterium]
MQVRLQKFLADAGAVSRRAGELCIREGQVCVNGQVVTALGTKVDPATDRVTLDGQPVKVRRKLYVALHKPPGYLCTRNDPEGRLTIGELLPREWDNLYNVGRLDRESEGLIFVTNDGDFCLKLTHPRYGIRKTYEVTVRGRVEASVTARMLHGVRDCGDLLKVEKARIITANNSHSLLEVELAEGKNREIRRLLAALGLNVARLRRVKIGAIKLGELPIGKWRTLTETEIKTLLSSL